MALIRAYGPQPSGPTRKALSKFALQICRGTYASCMSRANLLT
jgi:hypothetical protein